MTQIESILKNKCINISKDDVNLKDLLLTR
jgi:hypothetical protein